MATNPVFEDERPAGTILHRIGILGPGPAGRDGVGQTTPTPPTRAERRARRRLLNDIRDFLLEHDLDVTPTTLSAAHEACAGLAPGLARSIAQRKGAGLPITHEWLEEVGGGEAQDGARSVQRLADKLEHGIDELSRATRTVRRATSEYGDELERRVDGLAQPMDPQDVIAGLADFAKAMLARSRQTEAELRASERETAALREHLDRARREAEIDYLTGLPNRRAFETVLEEHYREASANGEALSVAFCDIDRFKAINDSHGHEAGDRIIRVVAETLSKQCGENCCIARHGGEEFVILFRGATPADAFAQLDAAREELAGRRMINRRTDKPFGVVTFSGGIADATGFATPREALAAADDALYRAKEGGRNRIEVAGTRVGARDLPPPERDAA